MNLTLPTAYYAAVQNEFPTDITRLTAQLTRVCDQNKEHKRLLNELAPIMGLKTNDGNGNRASMNIATDAVPLKTKDRKRGGGSPAAVSSATRGRNASNDAKGGGCALCKKYNTNSPNAWKTDPTNDCKKYNKDGTRKPFEFGNGNSRAQHGKMSQFATLKKEARSAKRRVKKMKNSSRMQKGTVGRVKRSTTALLVAAVPIRITNKIVAAAIHTIAIVDVLCLKTKMYRMLIVR